VFTETSLAISWGVPCRIAPPLPTYVVEREPQLQQETPLDVRARQAGVARHAADRSEQDGVVRRDGLQVGIRQDVARLQVAVRAEREVRLLEREPAPLRHRVEHRDGLGDDLRTDSVPGDDGELDGTGHDTPALVDGRNR
jgi:hypothetical protein